jgi:pentatricopeptide repeat protein
MVAQGKTTEAMEMHCRSPDPYTATFLISHAWKQRNDLDMAFSVYTSLRSSPVKLDAFVYTSLVRGCHKLNQPQRVIPLWNEMVQLGIKPDCQLYTAFLSGCIEFKDFSTAQLIVAHIEKTRTPIDQILQTVLIKLHTATGEGRKALKLWDGLRQQGGFVPDCQSFSSILVACADTHELDIGKEIHQNIIQSGILKSSAQNQLVLSSALINMYSKCGDLPSAQSVSCSNFFRRLSPSCAFPCLTSLQPLSGFRLYFDSYLVFNFISTKKDVIAWTAMMAAYLFLPFLLSVVVFSVLLCLSF